MFDGGFDGVYCDVIVLEWYWYLIEFFYYVIEIMFFVCEDLIVVYFVYGNGYGFCLVE